MTKSARLALFVVAVITLSLNFTSCSGLIDTGIETDSLNQPIISPAGGRFSDGILRVTMTDPADSHVFWTDDGSVPTAQSNLYGEAFYISNNVQLRAIAIIGKASS